MEAEVEMEGSEWLRWPSTELLAQSETGEGEATARPILTV